MNKHYFMCISQLDHGFAIYNASLIPLSQIDNSVIVINWLLWVFSQILQCNTLSIRI